MYKVNDDLSIYVTRGDMVFLKVTADNNGEAYTFQEGEIVRFKVYRKKDCEEVVLQKDFPVTKATQEVEIILEEADTKIGEVISKPVDYWYEVELNPFDNPQTIIGYDDDGTKVFRIFPEGRDLTENDPVITPEDIPVVDSELDLTSKRPVENQVVARAVLNLQGGYQATHDAVASIQVTPQMYGAVGDGKADDTEALQRALDSGFPVVATKKYLITSPICISRDYCNFNVSGEIISNDEGAIEINASYCKIYISKIFGTGNGVKLYCDDSDTGNTVTAYNLISLNSVMVEKTALCLFADGVSGIQYNRFEFGSLSGNTAILLQCGDNRTPWINQNAFCGGKIRGVYGVKTIRGANQTDKFNGNSFNDVGFEGITDIAIYLEYAVRNVFSNCRMAGEGEFSGNYWAYLVNSDGNLFSSPCMEMRFARIYDDNNINVNFPSYNRFEGSLFLYGLDSYAGRTAVPYSKNKYFVDNVLSSVSISAYGKNYDFANSNYLHNGFLISTGSDGNQNITYTFTEAFGRLIKSFFIQCHYKPNTSTIKFVNTDGTTAIADDVIKSGGTYEAVFTPSGWKLSTIS